MIETGFIPAPLLIAAALLGGLLVGSFLNVVILRVPARLEHDWRCQCHDLLELSGGPDPDKRPPGPLLGRSHCTQCGHGITAVENIPLVSYLFLRGKCSACSVRISPRYPVVEAVTGLLFAIVIWHLGANLQGLAALFLTAYLVALTGIDIDHQLLPDNMTLPLLWFGLTLNLFDVFTDPVSSLLGAMFGYLFLWGIYHLFRLLTGKEGMGYGDFKLLAALGAWLGWQALPLIILLSSLVGAVVGLVMMALHRHQKDQPMPFGPFIATAGWITLIWGNEILAWYLS
jgi:leader peptidase (prepilin peptidase)/N-methyltransferase